MRYALALLMALHSLAHVVSFVEAWRLIPEGFPYKTTVLAGRLDLGHTGIRVLGLIWLVVAVGFVGAAVGAIMIAEWWAPMALATSAVSLLLTASEWPEARVGIYIDVVLVGSLIVGSWYSWL